MAKIYGDIEVALTMTELQQALSAWVGCKTSIYDHRVLNVKLQPNAKFVVRFTVQPPLKNSQRVAIEQPEIEAKDGAA